MRKARFCHFLQKYWSW